MIGYDPYHYLPRETCLRALRTYYPTLSVFSASTIEWAKGWDGWGC